MIFPYVIALQNALVLVSILHLMRKGEYKLDAPSILMIFYATSNFLYVVLNK